MKYFVLFGVIEIKSNDKKRFAFRQSVFILNF